jgi:MFS family permease
LTTDEGRPRGLLHALRETTFRSLRHRDYRLYFAGQFVSFTGSWMQSAALMWLMFDRTGDPRWPSWLLVAQVGPTVLLGPWGGHLADRRSKRALIFATQFCFLVNAVLLAALVGFDLAPAWLILTLQAMSGVVQAVDLPARLAFLPDLVPKEDLINAVGLNSLLFNSARAIGPAVAGGLFLLAGAFATGRAAVHLGAVGCFAVNAASFVAVLFALRAVTATGAAAHHPHHSAWDGFRYLAENPRYGGLVLLTLALCVFGWPVLTVLPAYTRTGLALNEQAYSLLVSAMGGGALVAALATATFGNPQRRAVALVVGAGFTAAGIGSLARADALPPAAACVAATGFGLILFLSTGQSALQLAVPDARRGRVMALWAMTLSASAPLGHLLAGEAVARYGVRPTLWAMAVGAGAVAAGLAGVVRWRAFR